MAQKWPGNGPEMAQKCPGNVPEKGYNTPLLGLVPVRRRDRHRLGDGPDQFIKINQVCYFFDPD